MDASIFKNCRLAKRMSQSAFGSYLGISESTVAAIENKRRNISDAVRYRLEEKISVDDELIFFRLYKSK
ncbi:hypothetical protein BTO30_02960 [Domibacillus antri]|uniref:HTH cro/C1-type domain-containing protein n=1 Tax=Domibacillus antri TaxID=1714264 RepID=A0A1Q8Q8P9_9BACI|nr:helix-turn-helix transcriptional regulator [Domibacillus antri]OLN23713.1 hypothetical protein BTO30_02960 [Domibacillus antri]